MKKRLTAALLAVMILLICCACSPTETEPGVQIRILKIGKADAIIIKTASHALLIDSGEDDDGEEIVDNLKEMRINKLDMFVVTHYDKDHIGGAPEVMTSINIDEIIEPGYEKESAVYDLYSDTADAVKIKRTVPESNDPITLDGVQIDILMPRKKAYDDENDSSIALRLTCGEKTLMFLGDAKAERLLELMTYEDITADFVKAAHHGSYNSVTDPFYDKMDPDYAVITCSEKNPPDEHTLSCFEKLGTEVIKTSDGDVTVKVSADRISIYQ